MFWIYCFIWYNLLFLLQIVFETLYLIERYFPFRWPMSGVWQKIKESYENLLEDHVDLFLTEYVHCSTCMASSWSLLTSGVLLPVHKLRGWHCRKRTRLPIVGDPRTANWDARKLIKNNQLDQMTAILLSISWFHPFFDLTSPPCCLFS